MLSDRNNFFLLLLKVVIYLIAFALLLFSSSMYFYASVAEIDKEFITINGVWHVAFILTNVFSGLFCFLLFRHASKKGWVRSIYPFIPTISSVIAYVTEFIIISLCKINLVFRFINLIILIVIIAKPFVKSYFKKRQFVTPQTTPFTPQYGNHGGEKDLNTISTIDLDYAVNSILNEESARASYNYLCINKSFSTFFSVRWQNLRMYKSLSVWTASGTLVFERNVTWGSQPPPPPIAEFENYCQKVERDLINHMKSVYGREASKFTISGRLYPSSFSASVKYVFKG